MLIFNKVAIEDKSEIKKRLDINRCRCCDFSFANLVSWAPKFNTEFATIDDNIFFRVIDSNGQPSYLMPLGSMPVKESIQLIMEDAKKSNNMFQMRGVTTNMLEKLEDTFPNMFANTPDKGNYEYIYETERLSTLAGKKLQKKRNHINKFKSENPDWSYEKITSQAQLDDCLMMLKKWDNIENNDKHLNFDYIATKFMIDNFFELDLVGGLILVKGKIIAFSIGSELTNDTLNVHIEKAFAEINGAYTIINQQFAEHEGANYKYLNREEDMGIEGLRKAKMSYYPDILLKESIVTLKK